MEKIYITDFVNCFYIFDVYTNLLLISFNFKHSIRQNILTMMIMFLTSLLLLRDIIISISTIFARPASHDIDTRRENITIISTSLIRTNINENSGRVSASGSLYCTRGEIILLYTQKSFVNSNIYIWRLELD